MVSLALADSLEVVVLVDNSTDNLSTVPAFVETEFAALTRRRRGRWVLSGKCMCCAAHGLSCLIRVRRGAEVRTILFDTGPEDRTFEQNVSRLGEDPGPAEAIVLSHGHFDHTGAVLRALDIILDRNGGREIDVYTHPGMFRTRAMKQANGSMRLLEDVPSIDQMTALGARVVNATGPQLLAGNTVYLSGEIPRVTPFERGLPGQHRKTADGSDWEPDELVSDERFLAMNVKDKGLVVFSACSHAGIVNVLAHARDALSATLHAVVGGLHLSGSNEAIIPETVEAMREFEPAILAPGHCTGWRAIHALIDVFGQDRLIPLSVGKRFTF